MTRWALAAMLIGASCATSPAPRTELAASSAPRFEALAAILSAAEQWPCTRGLMPIPATVIDVGLFRNVPYQSFSNGSVELNGYGDPVNLVAFEAGTKAEDPALKACLIQFVASQALFAGDRARVVAFDSSPRSETERGLTIESTPASAPDAYGAWWISLELTKEVGGAAATEEELANLSTTSSNWSPPPGGTSATYGTPAYPSSYRRSSGGPVFVHGYTKKNGTYVHSYTRRR